MPKYRWPALVAFCEKHNLGFSPVDLPRAAVRFRLRTLLIVITVLGIILAIVGNVLIHVRQQAAIAERIRAAGGGVYFQNYRGVVFGHDVDWDEWNRKCFGQHTFRHIKHVHLDSSGSRNDVLALLPKLSRLEALELSTTKLTPEKLRHIVRCRRLQTLDLDLGELEMESCSLVELRQLPRLRELTLSDFDNDRLLDVTAISQLEQLRINSRHTTPAALAELKKLPNLKRLEIEACVDDQHETCAALVGCNQLENLSLRTISLNAKDFEQLAKLPRLRQLHLSETTALDVEAATALRQVTQLQRLGVWKYCDDESLAALAGMPELEVLYLHGADISDVSVPALRKFPKLRDLFVAETKLTADGVMEVARNGQLRNLGVNRDLLSSQQNQELLRRKPPVFVREQ